MHAAINHIELSVVVLCYRSEDFAEQFVLQIRSELEQMKISYELIMVANYIKGSQDTTPEIAKKLAEEYKEINSVSKEKEGWMGWDMRSGLDIAKGKLRYLRHSSSPRSPMSLIA